MIILEVIFIIQVIIAMAIIIFDGGHQKIFLMLSLFGIIICPIGFVQGLYYRYKRYQFRRLNLIYSQYNIKTLRIEFGKLYVFKLAKHNPTTITQLPCSLHFYKDYY